MDEPPEQYGRWWLIPELEMDKGSTMAVEFFTELGVKTQDLVAGFAGGVVNAFVFQRSNPVAIVGSVVVGAFTAAYLTEPAAKLTGTTGGATAFIVGLAAMAICQTIITQVSRWKPSSNGGKDAG